MSWSSDAPRPRPAGGAAGFTLLEMLVVLALLGLSLGLVLGAGRPVPAGTAARAAAGEIAGALRLARSQAILGNRPVAVTLDLASRRYRVGAAPDRALPPGVALGLLTASGQVLGEAAGRIRFEPDGSSTGGRVTVTGGARTVLVGVDWLSGRASVLEQP